MIDLSDDLEPHRIAGKLPALVAAAWRGSELVGSGATGVRHAGAGRATLHDRWHLGSETKAMTAVLVAKDIDRRGLRFETTLGEVFGEGVHPGYADVTLEQLLWHRGGLPHDYPSEVFDAMRRDAADASARRRAALSIIADQPAQAPGRFVYSNAGYMTAGVVLETVTGRPWEDLIRSELFEPLGMSSFGFGAPDGDSPWGHDESGRAFAPGPGADNPPAVGPAGTVHGSLIDWGKFLVATVSAVRGESPLASAAIMTRLLTPPSDAAEGEAYAGGWMFLRRNWGGGTVMTHGGSNTLWLAVAWLAPGKNLSFAAAANRFEPRAVDAAFGTIMRALNL